MISNIKELEKAALDAGSLLQSIQDYVGQDAHPAARVRFPRGFIRSAEDHRKKLDFIAFPTLKKNVSYALMALDVYRWVISRTDLMGQAYEMMLKEAICLMGSICESIMIRPGYPGLGKGKSFKDRAATLAHAGVIEPQLETDLEWLWEIRCREHIEGVAILEWSHYKKADLERATTILNTLFDCLSLRFRS